MPGRARLSVLLLGAALLIAAAALVLNTIPPTVPGTAASEPIIRTSQLENDAQCFDRIERGQGWLQLCWATSRATDEADASQDYYTLHFYGSYQGLRWAVFGTDLVGEPSGGSYMMWPDFDVQGDCQAYSVDLGPVPHPPLSETLCGRLTAAHDVTNWRMIDTWTCRSCLAPDDTTKGIDLYNSVVVPADTIPEWDLFVDGGS